MTFQWSSTTREEAAPLLLTRDQVAERCQVNLHMVDEWTHRRGFPVIREGRLVRIPARELEQWLAREALATNGPAEQTSDPAPLSVVGKRR